MSISTGMSTSPARPSRAQGSVSVQPATIRQRPRFASSAAKASASDCVTRYSSQVSMLRLASCAPSPRLRGEVTSLRRLLLRGAHVRFHHHLDRILDAILGIADRGRQIVEREGVRVDLGRIEALLPHEGFGAMRRALALAADAVEINVV